MRYKLYNGHLYRIPSSRKFYLNFGKDLDNLKFEQFEMTRELMHGMKNANFTSIILKSGSNMKVRDLVDEIGNWNIGQLDMLLSTKVASLYLIHIRSSLNSTKWRLFKTKRKFGGPIPLRGFEHLFGVSDPNYKNQLCTSLEISPLHPNYGVISLGLNVVAISLIGTFNHGSIFT
ncbi:hypothetical protein CR513_61424, partial [Mucuna pruriens]